MNINKNYLKKTLKTILETPSPSGYTHHITELIKNYIEPFGYEVETTHKGALVITIPGKDDEYILGLSAHVDTLGLMVRSIDKDGTLKITSLGGQNIKAALIGPGVHASHGMERTHMNALTATIELIYHYLVNA